MLKKHPYKTEKNNNIDEQQNHSPPLFVNTFEAGSRRFANTIVPFRDRNRDSFSDIESDRSVLNSFHEADGSGVVLEEDDEKEEIPSSQPYRPRERISPQVSGLMVAVKRKLAQGEILKLGKLNPIGLTDPNTRTFVDSADVFSNEKIYEAAALAGESKWDMEHDNYDKEKAVQELTSRSS